MPESVALDSDRASLRALFSYGFRPFFLGAAVYAVIAMAVWVGWVSLPSPAWALFTDSPFAWHAHEMVFGFAAAAVAGFLLTAVPNWTGALPISGPPLMLLFATWVVGRIAMLAAGVLHPAIVAAVDLAFLPFLGFAAARQLFVKPAAKNVLLLTIITAMIGANIAYHLTSAGVSSGEATSAVRFALMLLVLMIAIIGGRVIPAFTHNWLHLNVPGAAMPKRYGWLDATAIATVAAVALLQVIPAPSWLLGSLASAAAGANGARLLLWRGVATRRAPIVWILHVAYAWLVVGLALMSMGAFSSDVRNVAAMHAFGAGAVATMIMAIMSRASLGHTGRTLIAPNLVVFAYALLTLAAVLRVFGPGLAPAFYVEELFVAGLAWIAAFALFIVVYAPILMTPRVRAGSLQ
jgi:uncharacterized protein involved in response to NO